jgi:hypothetical protein
MIEQIGIGDAEFTAHAAEAEVARAEDETADARRDQSASAHDAGFESAVQGGLIEAVVADAAGRFSQGQDFGVSGRIVPGNRRIGAAAYDFFAGRHDGSHRHFIRRGRGPRQIERFPHQPLIVNHSL